MSDEQSFLAILFALFWLLPLLIATLVGRFVTPRQAVWTVAGLLVLLVSGAVWAYLENRGQGYGPEFALHAYLAFVASPVLGCGILGLSLGQFWRRKV